MLNLSLRSLWNRRFTAFLTVLAIGLSVALILGVERLRTETRNGFTNSASGIDMIVAARGNSVQILLATIFGVGSTGNAIDWQSYEMVANHAAVDWAVPVSMGDNHRGFPVIGTTNAYFDRFRHSGGVALDFDEGGPFIANNSAVVGAELAQRFGYTVGTEIVNAHGSGAVAFDLHDEAPFTITGTLRPTGTATDRMVFVSLQGFDRLHVEKAASTPDPFLAGQSAEDGNKNDAHDDAHHPASGKINAVLVGLSNRLAVLTLQRTISDHPGEPLTAVMPGIALLELWSITGAAENALRLMAMGVALAGLLGLVIMLLSTLEERRREFTILRSVGATPSHIFRLIVLEALLLTMAGLIVGLFLLYVSIAIADPILAARFGLRMGLTPPSSAELLLIVLILVFGLLASLIPAYRVYRTTLADGLTVRL